MQPVTIQSRLHHIHQDAEAFFLPYGTADSHVEVVETIGNLDMEYATIRKGAAFFDEIHKGCIKISGDDRIPFLNNLITQQLDGVQPGNLVQGFTLNRKGKITADLTVLLGSDSLYIIADRHDAPRIVSELDAYIFTEDVVIEHLSDSGQLLSIHGPTASKLIQQSWLIDSEQLEPNIWNPTETQGIEFIYRSDFTGGKGLYLWIENESIESLYQSLIDTSTKHPELKASPTGWLAMNTARIEAGNPLYPIDFDDTCVPAETSLLESRVDFNKGCYLGQEVVARMHARKAQARGLVAIKLLNEQIETDYTEVHQPIGGSQIFEPGKEGETPIGYVTSSTISPMIGAIPVCFAIVKSSHMTTGTRLVVSAEGKLTECSVQSSLVFWSAPDHT